jgi:signal peptidase
MTDADGRRVRDNNTHRIVDIVYNESDKTINHFVTQGDAMKMEDPIPVTPDEILAKQVGSGEGKNGLKIAGLGHALDFLQSRTGFMICIIIPLALFFIWQIYKLIMMFMESKAEEIDEETKRRAIEEYLAKQEAEKEDKNKEFKSENDYEYPKDSGPKTEEKESAEKESE